MRIRINGQKSELQNVCMLRSVKINIVVRKLVIEISESVKMQRYLRKENEACCRENSKRISI